MVLVIVDVHTRQYYLGGRVVIRVDYKVVKDEIIGIGEDIDKINDIVNKELREIIQEIKKKR